MSHFCIDNDISFIIDVVICQWSIPVPQCLAPCIIPQIEEGVASEGVGEKVSHLRGLNLVSCYFFAFR